MVGNGAPTVTRIHLLNLCLAAFILVSPCAAESPAFHKEQAFARDARAVNQQAAALLRLDATAKRCFQETHPQVTLPARRLVLPKSTVPAFDWCNLNCVSEGHRQRSQDCWANAAIEALECSYLIRNGKRSRPWMSPQPIFDYYQHGAGAQPGTAFQFLLKHGTAGLEKYPYTGKPGVFKTEVATPYRAAAWGYVATNSGKPTNEQLKQALLVHGPVVVLLYSTAKFDAYTGGVFKEHYQPQKVEEASTHAVLLVGWDDSRGRKGCWKIKNSWDQTWGEQGFMWIEYDCNQIGMRASWVRAASRFYMPAAEFYDIVKDARPFPAVRVMGSQVARTTQQTALQPPQGRPALPHR
jgi:C1A family cysteine protease